jgi:hypothetical protein
VAHGPACPRTVRLHRSIIRSELGRFLETAKIPNDRFQVEWSGPVAITSTELNSSTKNFIDHSNTYVQALNSSALLVAATLANNPTTKISVENTAKGSFSHRECKKIDKHSFNVNKAEAVEWVPELTSNGSARF